MSSAFDYTTVGHVTVDVLADGLRQPGGGAFYSALQAARLGLRTLILTRGVPRELEELLEPYRRELEVEILPAERTTTLGTWQKGASRRQRLLAWAGPIEGPVVLDTSILHFAPVARETPRAWRGRAEFVGLTPQGLVRAWDARGDILPAALHRERLPERCDALVFSTAELDSCAELIPRVAPRGPGTAAGPVVAVTAGARPVALHLSGGARIDVPVPPIEHPHDDLGAGDVFAAAFFATLRDGLSPTDAAVFANAAAAVRIAGLGPLAIGDRAVIEARIAAAPADGLSR